MKTLLFFLAAFFLSHPSFAAEEKNRPFPVETIAAGSIFEKLGLKEGDVLKSYNGKPFKTSRDLKKLEKLFVKPGTLKLKIYREGKLEELTYDIK